MRFRHKYTDVPVPPAQAFVFTRRGVPAGSAACTLTELAAVSLAKLIRERYVFTTSRGPRAT